MVENMNGSRVDENRGEAADSIDPISGNHAQARAQGADDDDVRPVLGDDWFDGADAFDGERLVSTGVQRKDAARWTFDRLQSHPCPDMGIEVKIGSPEEQAMRNVGVWVAAQMQAAYQAGAASIAEPTYQVVASLAQRWNDDDSAIITVLNALAANTPPVLPFYPDEVRRRPANVSPGDAFAITTCDPQFDPSVPVLVNGYRFIPVEAVLGAGRLLAEAAALFRSYEAVHRAKMSEEGNTKAHRNAAMADRIESYLSRDATPEDTVVVAARGLVDALDSLIGSSSGVYGLHLNDDPAPWGTLLRGGHFEQWLAPLDDLRDALDPFAVVCRHPNAFAMPAAGGVSLDRCPDCNVDGVDLRGGDEPQEPSAIIKTMEAMAAANLVPGLDRAALDAVRKS